MQISAVNSVTNQKYNTNFKSTFPVAYWVKDKGKYAPVTNLNMVKDMQRKLIAILNYDWLSIKKKKPMNTPEEMLRTNLSSKDVDYRLATEFPKYEKDKKTGKLRRITPVRSFINRVKQTKGSYDPISYFITGYENIVEFNDINAKNIGREKGLAKTVTGIAKSSASNEAVKFYNNNGMEFVNDSANILTDGITGIPQVLHVIFEIPRDLLGNIVRNKKGKMQYQFIKGELKPAYGPDNPFEKLKKRV